MCPIKSYSFQNLIRYCIDNYRVFYFLKLDSSVAKHSAELLQKYCKDYDRIAEMR